MVGSSCVSAAATANCTMPRNRVLYGCWQAERGCSSRYIKQCAQTGWVKGVIFMRYMVVVEKGPSSYGAFVPDLPGCIAVGETEAEALALIEEAIRFHLEDMKAGGLQIPLPASKSTFVEVALAA